MSILLRGIIQQHRLKTMNFTGSLGLYANLSADIADRMEPIEQAIVERQMQFAYTVDTIIQLLFLGYMIYKIIHNYIKFHI